MELKQLEFFVTATDCGSLSKAAAKLYTSQPNVSKVIAALEQELGHRLFERTSRGLRLTPYGKSIYEYAVNTLKSASMIAHMNWTQALHSFAVSTYSSHMLANVLVRLYQNHPDLQIEHRQGTVNQVVSHVEQGISEMGLLYVSQSQLTAFRHIIAHKKLDFIEISRRQACIYVGPNNPLFARDSVTREELMQLQFIRGLYDYFEIEHNFKPINVGSLHEERFSSPVSTNSEHLVTSLVQRTPLAILGFSLDDPIEPHPGMKHLWIEGEDAEQVFGTVIEKGRAPGPFALELLDLLKGVLRRDGLVKSALRKGAKLLPPDPSSGENEA